MDRPSDLYFELRRHIEDVRSAFVARWSWFSHRTPHKNLQSILTNGLQVRRPKGGPAAEVVNAFGPAAANIVCLHPEGAALRPDCSDPGDRIQLALAGVDLPYRVSTDWSYCPDIVAERWIHRGVRSVTQVAVDLAHELGSVASYDPIPGDLLRVRVEESADHPSTWPRLVDTNLDEILVLPGPLEIDPFETDLPLPRG